MGYTHYFEYSEDLPAEKFAAFSHDVKRLFEATDILITGGWGEPGTSPEVTDFRVVFNGLEPDSHETFALTRFGSGFNFCKTQQKPYDVMVVAVLTAAHHHFGSTISISSDGEASDWSEGIAMCEKVLGYGECPFGEL